jgi:hypothetical protein
MKSDYFAEKAVGITVVHLRASCREKYELFPHSPMDYHIHNLLYFDPELKHAGALCLDTNNLQTVPCPDSPYLKDAIKSLNMVMAQLFVDKIDSMIKAGNFSKEMLFNRAEQDLWDVFNRIKETTFMQNLPRLAEYLQATGASLQKEKDIIEEPDRYKWAEITLSEERINNEKIPTGV